MRCAIWPTVSRCCSRIASSSSENPATAHNAGGAMDKLSGSAAGRRQPEGRRRAQPNSSSYGTAS